MATKFKPLTLNAQLHDLPQNYAQRIRCFGAVEGDVTIQQHLDRFNDFIDLEEVDYEDVKMRLFAQSLSGEVNKWFRVLPLGITIDSQQFENMFLNRWEEKKNTV